MPVYGKRMGTNHKHVSKLRYESTTVAHLKENRINKKGIDRGRIRFIGRRHEPGVRMTPQNHLQPFLKITIAKKKKKKRRKRKRKKVTQPYMQIQRGEEQRAKDQVRAQQNCKNGSGVWLTRAEEEELKRR
jgi:hypothetical protein